MPRIRSVHPGLFTDEAFVSVAPCARLLHIALWTEADDQGVFEWKPLAIKMRLFPADNVDVPALLAELAAANMVRQFTAEGRAYGAVRNFQRFQRPKKPNALYPMPPEFRTYVGSSRASSGPDDDDGGSGSPPPADESPQVPPKAEIRGDNGVSVPQKSEIAPQMEDGGGRMEEEDLPLASLAPSPRAAPRRRDGPSAAEIEDWFESWWVNYPRKVGKIAARKAYDTALRKVGWDRERLLTPMLLTTWDEREGGKFIPHPATWLNEGRWADGEPPRPAPPPELPLH